MPKPVQTKPDSVQITLVDVAAQARALFGEEGAAFISGRVMPETDWRFELSYQLPGGGTGQTTMSRGATAGQVAALIERDRREGRIR